MKKIVFVLTIFSFGFVSAQNLTGRIIDNNNNPVEYFNVVLLSPKDSSMITGGAFTEGKFSFTNLKEQVYLLKVSGLGYADFRQQITVENTTELSPIILQTKTLQEVSVTARRPIIQSKADRTIVTVEGSILSNAINGNDMLQKTPGLIRDPKTGDFTVAGKGTPIFYINGRLVQSMEEIRTINPQDIKTIDIIDNPSSAYDADGHAVVLITTIKHTERYLLSISNQLQQSRHLSNETSLEGIISFRNITINGYYDFARQNNHTYERDYSNIDPNSTMLISDNTLISNYQHTYRTSVDWNISKTQLLSFQLNGNFGHYEGPICQTTQFSALEYRNYTSYKWFNSGFHQLNGTINYDWKIDTLGQNLKITGDYTQNYSDLGISYYNVINGEDSQTPFYNTSFNSGRPLIYSLKGDYTKFIGKTITIEVGAKAYQMKGNNHTNLTGNTILFQHYETKESNSSAYLSLSSKINDKWNLRIGLREENMHRTAIENNIPTVNLTQFGFFPSALVNYGCSKNLAIGFSYSKRISRPSLAALDPSLFTDSLWTRQGNPNLKSTNIHTFLLTMKIFNMLSLRAGYNYKINPIYFLVYKDSLHSQVTDCRYANGVNAGNFFVAASFNQNLCKWWSTSVSANLSTNSYLYYDDNNVQRNNNHPKCNGNIQNTFTLPWNITFDTGFQYNGTGSMSTLYITKPAWNLFGSLQRGFLHKTLQCTLSANDVFQKNISYQQSVLKGNNLNVFDGDNRYIVLSIKYQIGKSKYQYQSQSATQEEKARVN